MSAKCASDRVYVREVYSDSGAGLGVIAHAYAYIVLLCISYRL